MSAEITTSEPGEHVAMTVPEWEGPKRPAARTVKTVDTLLCWRGSNTKQPES